MLPVANSYPNIHLFDVKHLIWFLPDCQQSVKAQMIFYIDCDSRNNAAQPNAHLHLSGLVRRDMC